MNFRKGDIVSMRGVVKHNFDKCGRVFVDVEGCHDTLRLGPERLTLVSAKFEIGASDVE